LKTQKSLDQALERARPHLPLSVQDRFVDMLFMLYERKVPPAVAKLVERQEGDLLFWKNGQMRGALMLGCVPYDANMAMLGFALFGEAWALMLKDVEKTIAKRWKIAGVKKS